MTNKFTQFFLLFAVILVLTGFSIVLTSRQANILPTGSAKSQIGSANNPDSALVVGKSYSADANTYTGSIVVDSGCSALSTDVELKGENPEKIVLNFGTKGGTGNCPTPTPKKDFIVVVPSSETAQLEQVLFNGEPVAFVVHSQ